MRDQIHCLLVASSAKVVTQFDWSPHGGTCIETYIECDRRELLDFPCLDLGTLCLEDIEFELDAAAIDLLIALYEQALQISHDTYLESMELSNVTIAKIFKYFEVALMTNLGLKLPEQQDRIGINDIRESSEKYWLEFLEDRGMAHREFGVMDRLSRFCRNPIR